MSNICPICGGVMCEQADETEGPNGMIFSTPNGKFICYHCEKAKAEVKENE